MADISSTGIFKNKMRIFYCSSSTCPNRESVSESFILYNSWVMNLGNKSNTQLCPLPCQSHCLSDRQVSLPGTEESPSRSPPETLSLGPGQPLPWPSDWKWGTVWFSGHYIPKALGTVVTIIMGDFERGDTKLFLRIMYKVNLGLKTESIHTTLFISPGQKC